MGKVYDYLFKIILIGNSGVGKSCLQSRFADDFFNARHVVTLGLEFKFRDVIIDGKRIRLQIWDTAGQEQYSNMLPSCFYRGAEGVIFVYDITDQNSFDSVSTWMSRFEQHAPADAEQVLIGNKSDEENCRKISKEKGADLAKAHNMTCFFETSAKTDVNVGEAFVSLARAIKVKVDAHSGAMMSTSAFGLKPQTTKQSGCCLMNISAKS